METCEKYQKLYDLDGLRLEMYALIDVLERALKCDEFEDGQSTNTLYLVEIIKEKFEKISFIIQELL